MLRGSRLPATENPMGQGEVLPSPPSLLTAQGTFSDTSSTSVILQASNYLEVGINYENAFNKVYY